MEPATAASNAVDHQDKTKRGVASPVGFGHRGFIAVCLALLGKAAGIAALVGFGHRNSIVASSGAMTLADIHPSSRRAVVAYAAMARSGAIVLIAACRLEPAAVMMVAVIAAVLASAGPTALTGACPVVVAAAVSIST